MAKLGRTIEAMFVTHQFSTGSAMDADSLPTGTIYKNGTADALSVTVTNITTGVYKAVFTPTTGAGFAAGDHVACRIAATVDSVAANAIIYADVLSTNDVDDVKTDTAAVLDDTGTSGVVIADGGITAAKIATDAVDADALATDAVNEIRDAIFAKTGLTAGASASFQDIIIAIYAASRGKVVKNGSNWEVYDDDDGTLLFTLVPTTTGRTVS